VSISSCTSRRVRVEDAVDGALRKTDGSEASTPAATSPSPYSVCVEAATPSPSLEGAGDARGAPRKSDCGKDARDTEDARDSEDEENAKGRAPSPTSSAGSSSTPRNGVRVEQGGEPRGGARVNQSSASDEAAEERRGELVAADGTGLERAQLRSRAPSEAQLGEPISRWQEGAAEVRCGELDSANGKGLEVARWGA